MDYFIEFLNELRLLPLTIKYIITAVLYVLTGLLTWTAFQYAKISALKDVLLLICSLQTAGLSFFASFWWLHQQVGLPEIVATMSAMILTFAIFIVPPFIDILNWRKRTTS